MKLVETILRRLTILTIVFLWACFILWLLNTHFPSTRIMIGVWLTYLSVLMGIDLLCRVAAFGEYN